MKSNQHVVQRPNGWAVLGEGNSRDTVVVNTQEEAINRARTILENQGGGEIVIHSREGRIRDKDTVGHDPFPPRDTK